MKSFERLFWTFWCLVAAFGLVYFGSRGVVLAGSIFGKGSVAGVIFGVVAIGFVIGMGLLIAIQGFVFLVQLWKDDTVRMTESAKTTRKAKVDRSTDPLLRVDPAEAAFSDLAELAPISYEAYAASSPEVLLCGGPHDGKTIRGPKEGDSFSFAGSTKNVNEGAYETHNYAVAKPTEWRGGKQIFVYKGKSMVRMRPG